MGHIYAKAADFISWTFFLNPKKLFFLRSSSLRQKTEDNRWILNRFWKIFHFDDQNNIRHKIWGPKKNPRTWPFLPLIQHTPKDTLKLVAKTYDNTMHYFPAKKCDLDFFTTLILKITIVSAIYLQLRSFNIECRAFQHRYHSSDFIL